MCAARLIDTQDLKWQADVKFAPDKESAWKHPMHKDGWMHAHNSLRAEIARFRDALAQLAARDQLRRWEVDCLQEAWAEHKAHVHSHHSNEDDVFMPFLHTRICSPDKLRDDHESLLHQLEQLDQRIEGLSNLERGLEAVRALHSEWLAYEAAMLPHLEEEEVTQLPLMRAYFRPEEITPIVQKVVGSGPPAEMGSFICTMGDEAFFEFMKQEGIPGFVWYLEFRSKRDAFQRLFIDNLDAVSEGRPPKRSGIFACCAAPEIVA